MDFIEVEGKTYDEAVKKAANELGVDEKDLYVDVREVDTKGILGLLGSKKIRITASIRGKEEAVRPLIEKEEPSDAGDDTEKYGIKFIEDLGNYLGIGLTVRVHRQDSRILFLVKTDQAHILTGKDGETLEALQYLLKLAIAKRYKQSQKLTIDINGFREKRKRSLTTVAKQLADKAKRTGRSFKTNPLNPYERRIIHTLFKNNKSITTKSEGDGHTKQVVISPVGGHPRGRR